MPYWWAKMKQTGDEIYIATLPLPAFLCVFLVQKLKL
jgi:hypothetical protein